MQSAIFNLHIVISLVFIAFYSSIVLEFSHHFLDHFLVTQSGSENHLCDVRTLFRDHYQFPYQY